MKERLSTELSIAEWVAELQLGSRERPYQANQDVDSLMKMPIEASK
jgi:hypothetical protein